MITRRSVIRIVVGALLGASIVARAQPAAGKVWRIGFLGVETPTAYARQLEELRTGLKDFGYVEGKNIVVEYRWAEGALERLPQLAVELLRAKVDVLVTHAAGVRAAHSATTTVPIVMTSIGFDPIAAGFAKSLGRPGGNITGSMSLTGILSIKQLELVKDTFPNARKVAFMIAATAAGGQLAKSMEAAAKTLNLDLQFVQITSANDFQAAIAGVAERRVEALIVATAPVFIAHHARIAELATRQRIPALGLVRFADSGGLIGYGNPVSWRRAAYFIDRIFKGAKPADLPIEQPTTIELVVNLKTARALGIRIPDTVMARANRVIEWHGAARGKETGVYA